MKAIIGIDPGAKCGFAVISYGILSTIITLSFWETIYELQKEFVLRDSVDVWIEDPNKNKPVFLKRGCNE